MEVPMDISTLGSITKTLRCRLEQGSPTSVPQPATEPWPVRNWAAQVAGWSVNMQLNLCEHRAGLQ